MNMMVGSSTSQPRDFLKLKRHSIVFRFQIEDSAQEVKFQSDMAKDLKLKDG